LITKEKALQILMDVYRSRPDLQDAYPEVLSGELQNLMNWAAGASSNRWVDSDRDKLSLYRDWFLAHERPAVRPLEPPVEDLKSILGCATNRFANTFEIMLEKSDVSEHLTTLYFLVYEFGLEQIVELGVGRGNSTITLLEAVASRGRGHVDSVDTDECLEAVARVKSCGLDSFWTFHRADDLQFGRTWNRSIDLLFIDTVHIYRQALAELGLFGEYVRKEVFICLHDTVSYPGVSRAVKEYLHSRPRAFNVWLYLNCNGLTVLRRRSI